MNRDEIQEKVLGVVEEVFKVDKKEIKAGASIKEDLGADSLDQVTFLMALEEEFDSSISDEEAQGLDTIENVINFIHQKAEKEINA